MSEVKRHFRMAVRGDTDAILLIDWDSYDDPLDQDRLIQFLRLRNFVCKVVEEEERIVGFVIYETRKRHLEIHRLAVLAEQRKKGVGRFMLTRLAEQLSRRARIELRGYVNERNPAAQLWLQRCGWRWRNTLPNWYGPGEDGYVMAYRPEWVERSE